ncbi:uncharacterized protein DDB_G0283697 isoform X2 [Orussus abietinus]|uniref:uncharacterized protein DDB_G0283697 isoform X2 n=1 Tax=Orussus abietinus TaxID=222816 RepID=UPI00062608A5|nr:uncharacterized protein DDB_G0283697 isoform X2 [Orussus abietinus]
MQFGRCISEAVLSSGCSSRARLAMQDRGVDLEEGFRSRNVRRRLFADDEGGQDGGPGEEDNLKNQLNEEIKRHRDEAKKRWNFDFEKEKPLPGRFEWTKLDERGNDVHSDEEEEGMGSKEKNNTEEKEKEEQTDNNGCEADYDNDVNVSENIQSGNIVDSRCK